MRLRQLVAAEGKLLHRCKVLPLALLDGVERCGLAESADGRERRQQAVFRDDELRRIAAVDIDGLKVEAAQAEFVADFKRRHQVLFHGGRILVVFDLADAAAQRVGVLAALGGVECLGADGEERRVERERLVHLEPRDAERHHNVCDRVRFREEVTDLRKRLDVPLRHVVLAHLLDPHRPVPRLAALDLALSDGLHDLKAHLRVKPHRNEVEHDIVTAADGLQNARRAADDQILRVAEPHVRAVGEA